MINFKYMLMTEKLELKVMRRIKKGRQKIIGR